MNLRNLKILKILQCVLLMSGELFFAALNVPYFTLRLAAIYILIVTEVI